MPAKKTTDSKPAEVKKEVTLEELNAKVDTLQAEVTALRQKLEQGLTPESIYSKMIRRKKDLTR